MDERRTLPPPPVPAPLPVREREVSSANVSSGLIAVETLAVILEGVFAWSTGSSPRVSRNVGRVGRRIAV
jgi:hypothetical protein